MRFLSAHSISPVQVYIGAGAIFLLLVLWIFARYGRHRYLHFKESETLRITAIQLGRMADAIEHLAVSIDRMDLPERRAALPAPDASIGQGEQHDNMSMIGR